MKNVRIKNLIFPVLLVLTCCLAHCWQHGLTGLILPYLPNKEIVSLAVLTPIFLVLTFFTTYAMEKRTGTDRPVRRSFAGVAVMLVIVLAAALYYLSYAARRYAGILPVPILPDFPSGTVTLIVSVLCILHLTVLLILRFMREKTKPSRVALSVIGWLVLNFFLFILTV